MAFSVCIVLCLIYRHTVISITIFCGWEVETVSKVLLFYISVDILPQKLFLYTLNCYPKINVLQWVKGWIMFKIFILFISFCPVGTILSET